MFSELRQPLLHLTLMCRIVWVDVEGVPLKLWTMNTFKRIANKWGDLIDIDGFDDNYFHSKRLCLFTKVSDPDLVEDLDDEELSDDDISNVDEKNLDDENCEDRSDSRIIPETVFEKASGTNQNSSEDPFGLYPLLNKKTKGQNHKENGSSSSLKFPPGFTPNKETIDSNVMGEMSVNGRQFKKSEAPRSGGSFIFLMEEVVKVGQTMGYNMDGVVNNLSNIIESHGASMVNFLAIQETKMEEIDLFSVRRCWGNSVFDHLHSNSVGIAPPTLVINICYGIILAHVIKQLGLKITDVKEFLLANLKKELRLVDEVIDKGACTEEDVIKRMDVLAALRNIDHIHSMDLAQKAKIKWSIEGDENSKFFHGILNKKRNQMNIRGIMVDGVWNEQPNDVKREFLKHFQGRFAKPSEWRASIDMGFPKTISDDQCQDLEREVSKEEIKAAVWDCGIDKSPGLDGFSFGFYRHFWSVIELDVYKAVNHFFIHGDIPSGCNSSFITLIPKIPNANLVKDFRPISLIESIYKIIAKILANRLISVLGDIVSDVQSAFIAGRQMLDGPFILNEVLQWGSILVNGSPTSEFQFHKGLKQGDPLSPFLFILMMESLHLSFQRIVDAGLFKGIVLDQSLCLSHMFYADDVIFVGHWSDGNISTLIHVLKCFFHASGLRINLSKSKIMGVNVESAYVKQAAAKLGCLVLHSPFYYLGTKVGGSMSRVQAWQEIVEKVKSRLSNWKMKTLSIGGRLTLLKSVLGSIPVFHMSLFKVPSKVLNLLESIRSQFFNGQNLGSLGLKVSYPKDSLWTKVIVAIHGVDGKVHSTWVPSGKSCWLSILNGKFRALQRTDRWVWKLEGTGVFSVASARRLFDELRLPNLGMETRWIKCVPIKINVLAWKIWRDALPTRFNISRRVPFIGVNLGLKLRSVGTSG
ncbi:RNA-directed DNA polymerase, eukaryota [Tanacetum coccineum]